MTHQQIQEKQKKLSTAESEKDRQAIEKEYAALDSKQQLDAKACLWNGNCNNLSAYFLEMALAELQNACTPPKVCGPEVKANYLRLNDVYVETKGIEKMYVAEGAVAFWATGGVGAVANVSTGWKLFGAGLGATTNYQLQDQDKPTDWVDVTFAGVTGYMTMGRNLLSSVTINTSGAMFGATLKGEDPKPAMTGAAVGTVAGYVAGKGIEIPFNNKLNPWYRPDWYKGYLEVSTWNAPSKVPVVLGITGSNVAQEKVGDITKNAIGNIGK